MMDRWFDRTAVEDRALGLVLHGILFAILIAVWVLTAYSLPHEMTVRDVLLYVTCVSAGLNFGAMICRYRRWRAGA